MTAAFEIYLNVTYAQLLALKSVYEKWQSVYEWSGYKLFSSRTMFELGHIKKYPKVVTWIACMRHVSKEVLTICQDRVSASFLFGISFRKLRHDFTNF